MCFVARSPKDPPATEESAPQQASRVAVVQLIQSNGVEPLPETVVGEGPASAVASFGARTSVRPLKRPPLLSHPSITIVSLHEHNIADRSRSERTGTLVLSTRGRKEMVSRQPVASKRSGRPEECSNNTLLAPNEHIVVENQSTSSLTPVGGEMKGAMDRCPNDAKPATRVAAVSMAHEKQTDQSTKTLTKAQTRSTVSSDSANVRLSMKDMTKQGSGELAKTMFDDMHYAEFEHNKFRRRPLKRWKSKTSIRSYETGFQCSATKITGNDSLDKRKA